MNMKPVLSWRKGTEGGGQMDTFAFATKKGGRYDVRIDARLSEHRNGKRFLFGVGVGVGRCFSRSSHGHFFF